MLVRAPREAAQDISCQERPILSVDALPTLKVTLPATMADITGNPSALELNRRGRRIQKDFPVRQRCALAHAEPGCSIARPATLSRQS